MKITGSTTLCLDALRAILREYPIQLAILFGSDATETTHTTSNIDVDDYRSFNSRYNDS